MGTKLNPSNYDCYMNAEADEPMFTLLARDITAPATVRSWALQRAADIAVGNKPQIDQAMVDEAMACADAMEAWRKVNR